MISGVQCCLLNAQTLIKPEIFIGNASTRIDASTEKITDQQTVGFIKQQLEAFAKFIEQQTAKN